MATDLIDTKLYTLTRFSRGLHKSLGYQITQYNKETKRHEYVHLTERQIEHILITLRRKRL